MNVSPAPLPPTPPQGQLGFKSYGGPQIRSPARVDGVLKEQFPGCSLRVAGVGGPSLPHPPPLHLVLGAELGEREGAATGRHPNIRSFALRIEEGVLGQALIP